MTALYVPPTDEADHKKQNQSLQLIGGVVSGNTTAIAALQTGTVTTIAGNSGAFTLSAGITNSTRDIRLSLTNATLQASPSNPTGTTSATGVMMGMGGTCKLTPTYSGRIRIDFFGAWANSTANNTKTIKMWFGTGTAPTNAAAITGTQVANALVAAQNNAANPEAFALGGIITGLTPATAYWFDLSLAVGAGTGTLTSLSFDAMEF